MLENVEDKRKKRGKVFNEIKKNIRTFITIKAVKYNFI